MEYNETNITEAEITVEEPVEESVNEEPVEETVAPPPEPVNGVVVGCNKLNIRKKPVVNDKNVIAIVEAGTEMVIIEPEKAKGAWYKVLLNDGVEGFCMKQYVTIE